MNGKTAKLGRNYLPPAPRVSAKAGCPEITNISLTRISSLHMPNEVQHYPILSKTLSQHGVALKIIKLQTS